MFDWPKFEWFQTRSRDSRKARELYGAVVAAARKPVFFRELGVPDTPEGRFEMVALVLAVAVIRLQGAEGVKTGGGEWGGETAAQSMIETFIEDMDDSMREMGVGDLSVPKKVRRAAAAFYERAAAYRAVIGAAEPDAIAAAILRYVFHGGHAGQAVRLAEQMRTLNARLNAVPVARIAAELTQFAAAGLTEEKGR